MSDRLKLIFYFIFFIFILSAYLFIPIENYLNLEYISNFIESESSDNTIIFYFILFFCLGSCLFISVPLMVLTTTITFDFLPALIISILGLFFGSTIAYIIGKLFYFKVSKESRPKVFDTFKNKLKDHTFIGVILIRLSPFPPYTISSFLLGALKIKYKEYILGSIIGLLPIVLVSLIFGKYALKHLFKTSSIEAKVIFLILIFFVLLKGLHKRKLRLR